MNGLTKQIMAMLNVDLETALKIQAVVDQSSIDYSQCTNVELRRAIREAAQEVVGAGS